MSFRTIGTVAKRMFRPYLAYKFMRVLTGYEKIITNFRDFSNRVIVQVSFSIIQFNMPLCATYLHFFLQLIEKSIESGSCTDSFVDKLVTIRKQNEDFTIQEIKAELHTLLIGVLRMRLKGNVRLANNGSSFSGN